MASESLVYVNCWPSGPEIFRICALIFAGSLEPAAIAATIPAAQTVPVVNGFVPVIYHLNVKDPAGLFLARRFQMRNKDILYVANAPIVSVAKVLNLFNLVTAPVVGAASIKNIAQ